MNARKILIRSVACVEAEGYVSKDQALVKGTQSTAQRVQSSFEMSEEMTAAEEDQYGPQADIILNWIMTCPLEDNGSDYLANCRKSIEISEKYPEKTYGFISSLVTAYDRHLKRSTGLDRITQPNAFPADVGEPYTGTGEVINVQRFPEYAKISMADSNGYLVTYTVNKDKKSALTLPEVGDKISVSGKVYRNKFTTPFETSLSRPTITKI